MPRGWARHGRVDSFGVSEVHLYASAVGTQGVIEPWEQLEPLVAAYNAQPANAAHPVVPTLVVMDNHDQSATRLMWAANCSLC